MYHKLEAIVISYSYTIILPLAEKKKPRGRKLSPLGGSILIAFIFCSKPKSKTSHIFFSISI
jgi:hypothetical protein